MCCVCVPFQDLPQALIDYKAGKAQKFPPILFRRCASNFSYFDLDASQMETRGERARITTAKVRGNETSECKFAWECSLVLFCFVVLSNGLVILFTAYICLSLLDFMHQYRHTYIPEERIANVLSRPST